MDEVINPEEKHEHRQNGHTNANNDLALANEEHAHNHDKHSHISGVKEKHTFAKNTHMQYTKDANKHDVVWLIGLIDSLMQLAAKCAVWSPEEKGCEEKKT